LFHVLSINGQLTLLSLKMNFFLSSLASKKIRFSENGAEDLQGVKMKHINNDKLKAGKEEINIGVVEERDSNGCKA